MANVLRCNESYCRKKLLEYAYVTSCSHVYCYEHGEQLVKDRNGVSCLACGTKLNKHHDVMKVNLKPSEQFKSMVLSGLSPEEVMDVAIRAVHFYMYQLNYDAEVKDVALKNAKMQHEITCINYKADIMKLQKYAESLKSELQEKIGDLQYHKDNLEKLLREKDQLLTKLDAYKRKVVQLQQQTTHGERPVSSIFGDVYNPFDGSRCSF